MRPFIFILLVFFISIAASHITVGRLNYSSETKGAEQLPVIKKYPVLTPEIISILDDTDFFSPDWILSSSVSISGQKSKYSASITKICFSVAKFIPDPLLIDLPPPSFI